MLANKILLALPVVVALASCGGGGGGADEACASDPTLLVITTWTVVGGTYNPSSVRDQAVQGRVGVPLSAKPVHTGIPASCAGKGTYTLGSASYPLPPGLTLNPTTGEISGTPTATGDTTGGGTDTGAVRLSLPGYGSMRVLQRFIVTN